MGGTGSVVGVAWVVVVFLVCDVVDVVPLALGWFVDEQAARRAPAPTMSKAPLRTRRAAFSMRSVSPLAAANGRSAGAPAHFRFSVAYRAATNLPMSA